MIELDVGLSMASLGSCVDGAYEQDSVFVKTTPQNSLALLPYEAEGRRHEL